MVTNNRTASAQRAPVSFDISAASIDAWGRALAAGLVGAGLVQASEKSRDVVCACLDVQDESGSQVFARLTLDEKRLSNLARKLGQEVSKACEGVVVPHKQARMLLGKMLGWETEHHTAALIKGSDAGEPHDKWAFAIEGVEGEDEDEGDESCFSDDPKGYFDYLESLGLAPVKHNPVKGDVLADVSIEGMRFQAAVSGWDLIVLGGWAGDEELESWVQYGPSVIAVSGRGDWGVCKYGDQLRIGLGGLSARGLRRLAVEMGLVFNYTCKDATGGQWLSAPDEVEAFLSSKAFAGAVEWAKAHPRKIAKLAKAGSVYMGDWAEQVRLAAKAV